MAQLFHYRSELEALDDLERAMVRFPIEALADLHRRRYIVQLSVPEAKGVHRLLRFLRIERPRGQALVLKRLGRKAKKLKRAELSIRHPEYIALTAEAKDLISKAELIGPDGRKTGLSPEDLRRYMKLGVALEPYGDEFAMLCFVEPVMRSREDLTALFDSLTEEDAKILELVLAELTSPLPSAAVDTSMLDLCARYSIPLSRDLDAENITDLQASLLEGRIVEDVQLAREAAMRSEGP